MKDNEKVILKYSWENLCSTEYHDHIPLVLIQNGKSTSQDIVSDVSPEYIKLNNSFLKLQDIDSSLSKPTSLLYYKKSEKCQMNEKEWNKKAFSKLNHNMVNRITLILSELPGNKLKLSLFRFRKEKRAGFQNFKKSSDDVHITINRDTNTWFYTKTRFANRKRNVSTSKNPFIWVENQLESAFKLSNIFGWYRVVTHVDAVDTEDPIRKEMVNALTKTYKELSKRLGQETEPTLVHNIIKDVTPSFGYNLGVLIAKWFCGVHKIKLPNHWQNYFFNFYPGIKKIRRTEMKLLPAIILGYGIKSKYINALLNQYPTLNINDIVSWFGILGPDFFRDIPVSFLLETSSSGGLRIITPHSKKSDNNFLVDIKEMSDNLSTQEKRNIISIVKTLDTPSTYFLGEIRDHIKNKKRLLEIGEVVSIRAKTSEAFKIEHREWSALLHYLMSDQSTEYYYNFKMLESIQKDYKDYKVIVLKNEEDYFEEGQKQKNCVRGYLSQYDSMIFSVRNLEDKRITCEAQRGEVIQIREVCNTPPTQEWDEVIQEMKNRVKELHNKNLLKPSVKKIYKRAKMEEWVVIDGKINDFSVGNVSHTVFGHVIEPDDLPF